MSVTRISRALGLVLAVTASVCAASSSDDALDRAKTLYVSADYDEALAVLNRLDSTAATEDAMSVAEYRVFCLLALDRRDEARESIDRILQNRPLYMPTEDEASPRIQSIFRNVRREVLPKIVLERYAAAKSAFERKDSHAADQFDEVVTLLNDPDLRDSSALRDLRDVASAFRDLARAVAATALPVDAPKAPVAQASVTHDDVADVIYTVADVDVAAPVARSQKTPPWYPSTHREATQEYRGVLRLLIDRSGTVVSATMPAGTSPEYDQVLLRAAREWKFLPAQKQGRPVRYLKVIEIHLKPGVQ